MNDRLDNLIDIPNQSRTQYRENLEALAIVLADEIRELADFESPGFVSSREFRDTLTGAVWASLTFQIEESNKLSIPFP